MFQLEKEMIPIIKRDLPRLFGATHSAEEFVSGNGRPDLVFACASAESSCWKGDSPDYQTIHLLIKFLNRQGRVLHVDEVFGVDVASHKKTQAIINTLKKMGFVEYRDEKHLVVRRKYRPIVEEFVSIEAKLSDWKSGIYQAARYKSFSNSSYLAISEDYIENVDRNFLKKNGIGLITVSNEGASIIVKAKKNKPTSIVSHYYLCERLLNS